MCTFGLSGCRVKPRRPHQTGPPGLAHDSPRTPKRAHLRVPALQTPPKFTKKTKREGKKNKKLWREREKKREILGPTVRAPTLRGPTLGGPTLRPHLGGPHCLGAPPFGPHHDTKNIGQKIGLAKIGLPKLDWPKLDLAKIGRAQTTMAKIGLAKIGLAKIGQIRMAKTGLAKGRLLPLERGPIFLSPFPFLFHFFVRVNTGAAVAAVQQCSR